jgi:hypothetical protein
MPHFVSRPGRQNFAPKRRVKFGPLGDGEIRPIAFGQQPCHAVVFVDQRTP